MAAGKWIGGILGFITSGTLGAILGFFIGSLIDEITDNYSPSNRQDADYTSRDNGSQFRQGAQAESAYEGQRNSFLFSLLVLASYVIRADGKIMHSEMEFVRQFLRSNFGENAVQQGQDILMKLFELEKRTDDNEYRDTIQNCCEQISSNMTYEQRLQLLDFLVLIAKADGRIDETEIQALRFLTTYLRIPQSDLDSMLNLQKDDLDSAYKVLGVSPSASNDEVKAAYRKLALKHHPDRVATLGEDIRKAAERKFQEINAAKDRIYKARGL